MKLKGEYSTVNPTSALQNTINEKKLYLYQTKMKLFRSCPYDYNWPDS